jgi:hypothetical protein
MLALLGDVDFGDLPTWLASAATAATLAVAVAVLRSESRNGERLQASQVAAWTSWEDVPPPTTGPWAKNPPFGLAGRRERVLKVKNASGQPVYQVVYTVVDGVLAAHWCTTRWPCCRRITSRRSCWTRPIRRSLVLPHWPCT